MKRKKVFGTPDRPRLAVFRSPKNISAQIIDDVGGRTLISASTVEKKLAAEKKKMIAAQAVGRRIAERALAKGIKKVVFDRQGFLYHGRIKAMADAAREGGLQF